MSKDLALFKIIIWSLIAMIFTLVFIGLLIFDDFNLFSYREENAKIIRTTEIDGNNVENIYLTSTYGSIYITKYEGDKIIIEEKSNKKLKESELFKISETNSTLDITQPRLRGLFGFSIFTFETRVTEIKVPAKQYNQISIKLTSGKLEANDLSANKFNFKITSGKIAANNLLSNELKTDMTSGKMDIIGSFNDIQSEATSGSFKLKTRLMPTNLDIEVTSGLASISIPENDGFVVNMNKTSGIFRSDFKLNDNNEYKNGEKRYAIKMTSGVVELLKND